MGNVIVFCESQGDSLKGSALSAIAAGRTAAGFHGGEVIALLVGKGVSAAADHACKYAPKVITVDDDRLETFMAETYAPVIAKVAKENDASVIVGAANQTGKDVIARVAGIVDAGMASDISAVVSKTDYKRPVLAGNAYVTIEVSSDMTCVTVRQSEVDPAGELDAPGSASTADAGEVNTFGAEVVRVEASKSDRPDLNEADVVVSGGRGMKNGENFKHIEELCDVLGAAMGASRAATDAGFVPSDLQVGQTGKVVAPNLYIAIAISGAIQHLAGMKNSKTIVAINKDAEAPIFQVADYGIVTTWEEAIPKLIEEIKKVKAAS